jgi:ribosome-associated protein
MKIAIDDNLQIDEAELAFTYSRSSGPGGQHVNKVETRVTLSFDVHKSTALDESQKRRILRRLSSRTTKDGVLRVSSQRSRSQAKNREAAIERFAELLQGALAQRRRRIETRVPKGAKQARRESKQRRATVKRARSRPTQDD